MKYLLGFIALFLSTAGGYTVGHALWPYLGTVNLVIFTILGVVVGIFAASDIISSGNYDRP